jgi:hypothetical protein
MYYASVDCLELPVRTLAQIRRTQKFLAEVDLSLYPVLPYIEFLSTAGASDSEISIFCPRTENVLAEEMSDQLTSLGNGAEIAQFTHEELYEETLKSTYVWSLGFNPQSTMCTCNVPNTSKQLSSKATHGSRVCSSTKPLANMSVKKKIRTSGSCSGTLRSFWRVTTGVETI